MNLQRILSMSRKEVFHILRDPFTLTLALALPVFMVTLFALAMEFNIKNIPMAVYDGDHSFSSRRFIELLGSSGYFQPLLVDSPEEGRKKVDRDEARAVLIFEPGFEYHLRSGRDAEAQVLVDGSDSSATLSVLTYLEGLRQRIARQLTGGSPPPPLRMVTRYLYNPELNSRWFSTPGLFGVVLGLLSILLTALTVAREWENGSMELLLSTPAEPREIILGKILPYIGLGLLAGGIVYVVARVFMGVPFRGSHFLFLLACLIFLLAYLSAGLLISVLLRRQQAAMQVSLLVGLLPSMLLSGFIFPVESMPLFFRGLTLLLPVRWFIQICRALFLKGSSLEDLLPPFFALTAIAAVLVFVAIKNFKTDVEP